MPLMHSHHINGEPIQRELAEKLVVQQQNGRHDEDLEFHDLPPFPDNVATAPLLRISLRKLQQRDPDEIERLWRACCDLGFFYLDSTNGADELLGTVEDMFKLGEGVFDLDEGEKEEFAMGKGTYFGYKGFGKDGADGNRNEFWNISKDDIFGISERLPNPPILNNEKSRALIKEYMLQSHGLVTLLLRLLNDKLALPPNTLESLHRLQAFSGDQVRWVKSPPQPPHDLKQALGAHTDFGSITILFNRLGGLQIHNEEEWKYVKPLRGHCIVNLGDAMVKFTAGVLRSNWHRVVNPPGKQERETRMSLVYFARPEDEVLLRKVGGTAIVDEKGKGEEDEGERVWTAKEWILRRAEERRGMFAKGHE